MPEQPYKNREIDNRFDTLKKELSTNIASGVEHVSDRLAGFEKDTRESLSRIEIQVSYTNGKVRKLIMAAILLGGILIGQNFGNLHSIIALLIKAV